MKKIKLIFIVLIFAISYLNHAANANSITLATTSWCPYTCDKNSEDVGIVGRYIESVLLPLGIKLKVKTYPWSRAIHLAEQGKVEGLLTATPQEAPNLLFTNSPISTYQMCLYTRMDSIWQYTQPFNIESNRFAVIQDYGYGEPIDSYVKENSAVFKVSGENSTKRLLDLLLKSRVDIIVEDSMVLHWVAHINNMNLSTIKQVACLPKHPFYLALTPTQQHKQLIKKLDIALREPKNLDKFKKLIIDNKLENEITIK